MYLCAIALIQSSSKGVIYAHAYRQTQRCQGPQGWQANRIRTLPCLQTLSDFDI